MKSNLLKGILSLLVIGLCGCSYHDSRLQQAKASVPEMRRYLVEQIPDLSQQERELIENSEPLIGHANYTIYYFLWKDLQDNTLFTVEATGPGTYPYLAKRNAK